MTTGEEVATWCVLMRDNQEKTIHVKCPEDCISYKQEASQLWAHGEGKTCSLTFYFISFVGVLGLCADSGPECFIFGGVCVLLLITTLVTVCVAIVCGRRQQVDNFSGSFVTNAFSGTGNENTVCIYKPRR